jgi:anti-sigma factor RsiW
MVLSCTDFKEDLSSFVDGELDQHRQSALASHLSACEGCKRNHEDFKQVAVLMRTTTAKIQETAPDLWSALSGRMPSVCECIQEDLSAYLDGELIASAKDGVSQHLEQCGECHARFQELSSVTRLLSTGLQLPEAFEVDIWAGIKTRLNDDCELIRTDLSAFIDREVPTLRHREVTAHLTECAECKDEFLALSQTGDVLRGSYQPEIPEDFDLWPAIQAKLNVVQFERPSKETPAAKSGGAADVARKVVPMRRLAAVAAAVVAGVGATMIYFSVNHADSPSVEPITAEAYLIDQSLGEPTSVADAVVTGGNGRD